MKNIFLQKLNENIDLVREWSHKNLMGLFIFNIILMVLILLHSAGYFAPYFPITINIIVLISLIVAVFLLGINSKALFSITLFFWIFGVSMRIFGVDIWAERTVIYAYESLIIGSFLLLFEIWRDRNT